MRQFTAAIKLEFVACGRCGLSHSLGNRARKSRQGGAGFACPLTYRCAVFMCLCLPDHPAPSARVGQEDRVRWDGKVQSGPARTPRPSFGFNSDGRSPDLRVLALPTFPALGASGVLASLTAYSCGGSRGFGLHLNDQAEPHRVPFSSRPLVGDRNHHTTASV